MWQAIAAKEAGEAAKVALMKQSASLSNVGGIDASWTQAPITINYGSHGSASASQDLRSAATLPSPTAGYYDAYGITPAVQQLTYGATGAVRSIASDPLMLALLGVVLWRVLKR